MKRSRTKTNMQITIKTPGSRIRKKHRDEPGVKLSESESLGFVLAAALHAVGPSRMDEVLGHCIEALADHGAFFCLRTLPASEAIDDLCDAAQRIVDAWNEHDGRISGCSKI